MRVVSGFTGLVTKPLLKPQFALLMSTTATPKPTFVLDQFCLRQFDDPEYTGTRVDFDKESFALKVNTLFESGKYPLVDGYAPFCKHLFIPNFTPATLSYLKITTENEGLLRSGYDARTEKVRLPYHTGFLPAVTASV